MGNNQSTGDEYIHKNVDTKNDKSVFSTGRRNEDVQMEVDEQQPSTSRVKEEEKCSKRSKSATLDNSVFRVPYPVGPSGHHRLVARTLPQPSTSESPTPAHVVAQSMSVNSFRRYYPKEYRQARVANKYFVRSTSFQNQTMSSDGSTSGYDTLTTNGDTDSPYHVDAPIVFVPPNSIDGSPFAKKPRCRPSSNFERWNRSVNRSFDDASIAQSVDCSDADYRPMVTPTPLNVTRAIYEDALAEVSPRTELAHSWFKTPRPADTDSPKQATPRIHSPKHFLNKPIPRSPMKYSGQLRPHSTALDEWPIDPADSYLIAVTRQTTPSKSRPESAMSKGSGLTTPNQPGPITSAVMRGRLTAKVRAWLSMDSNGVVGDSPIIQNGNQKSHGVSFHSALDAADKETKNGRPMSPGSVKSIDLFASLRRGKKDKRHKRPTYSQSVTSKVDDASSVGSLNSLTNGRTPWPIPWLEAIFLPEYPNKASVNETYFKTLGTIASGAFGKVQRVCLKSQTDAVFAMKVMKKSAIIARDAVQQIKHEISIHESVSQCAFVATLYASWQNRTNLYMVLQYVMGFGDLYTLWSTHGPLSEPVVRIYAAECAMALDFLHNHGVIYRDLKMENIVLDEQGHVQLVDFGLAKWLSVGDRTNTICGTLQYMAPEIAQERAYGHAVDWWSLGVLLHVLITGSYPFKKAADHYSLRFDKQTPIAAHASVSLAMLINQLLSPTAVHRLQGIHEFSLHPHFADFSMDACADRQIHPFDYMPSMKRCKDCNRDADAPLEKGDDGLLDILKFFQRAVVSINNMTTSQHTQGTDSYLSKMFTEDYDAFEDFSYFDEEEFMSTPMNRRRTQRN